MTEEELRRPPTEIEIGEIISLGGPISEVVRRLAFQRDMLAEERDLLKASRKRWRDEICLSISLIQSGHVIAGLRGHVIAGLQRLEMMLGEA